MDQLDSLIESFIQRTTARQWLAIRIGVPDDATKTLIVELLLEIITCIPHAVSMDLNSKNVVVTEEHILSTVGSLVINSFAKFICREKLLQCKSLFLLRDLIVKEMVMTVKFPISIDMRCGKHAVYVTPPCRLKTMVDHTCKTLSTFNCSMESRPPSCQRQSEATDGHTSDTQTIISVEPETAEEVLPLEQKFASLISEIVSQEDETAPLLNNLSDSEKFFLKSESAQEIEKSAFEIAKVYAERFRCLHNSQKNNSASLETAVFKIQFILAKQFIRTLIFHIVAELKTKFMTDSVVAGHESTLSLNASINHLLLLLTGEGQAPLADADANAFWNLRHNVCGKHQGFVQHLFHILYKNCNSDSKTEYVYTCKKLQCCFGLMRWWLDNQACIHGAKVRQALMGLLLGEKPQLPVATVVKETPVQSADDEVDVGYSKYAEDLENKRKASLTTLVQKVVRKIYKKGNGSRTENTEPIIKRLVEKLWAEVKDANFDMRSINGNLHVDIFEDLCEKWGSPKILLHYIKIPHRRFENLFVSLVKHHLTQPKSATSRFFLSVRRGIMHMLSYLD